LADQRHDAVLLFGAPGSGKGTQGKILGCVPGFFHVSTGDVFRGLDKQSELGAIFSEYSSRGELVPDDVTIRIWRNHMQSEEKAERYKRGRDIVLLDGIPRNVNQASLLDDEVNPLKIIHLTCSDDSEMIDRLRGRALKQGRADDAREEVVRRRLEIYREETQPVLDHYPNGRIASVDAIGAPVEVLARILEHLAPVQAPRFESA